MTRSCDLDMNGPLVPFCEWSVGHLVTLNGSSVSKDSAGHVAGRDFDGTGPRQGELGRQHVGTFCSWTSSLAVPPSQKDPRSHGPRREPVLPTQWPLTDPVQGGVDEDRRPEVWLQSISKSHSRETSPREKLLLSASRAGDAICVLMHHPPFQGPSLSTRPISRCP